jgi:hypothetical protein
MQVDRRNVMTSALQDRETSAEHRYDEWAKLICKLRWIGLDDETDRLLRAVRSSSCDERGRVLVDPLSTD